MAKVGSEALLEALSQVEGGTARFQTQDPSLVTLAPQVRTEEGKISWNLPARTIHDQVRAFNPWPGAFTSDGKQRIKILRTRMADGEGRAGAGSLNAENGRLWVATGDSWLEILELQREGKSKQAAQAFVPGYPIATVSRWR